MGEERTGRGQNYSPLEMRELAEGYKKYDPIINGKFTTKLTRHHKVAAWLQIKEAVNAVGMGNRTVKDLKIKLKNMKSDTKKVVAKNKREFRKTGGGSSAAVELSQLQSILASTIPEVSVAGIVGGIDLSEDHSNGVELDEPLDHSMDLKLDGTNINIENMEDGNLEEGIIVPYDATTATVGLHFNNTTAGGDFGEVLSPQDRNDDGDGVPTVRYEGTPSTKHDGDKRYTSNNVLLKKQISLLERQVGILSNIEKLMQERNNIERQKLNQIAK